MDLNSYKIATINLNNITNQNKINALQSFLRLQEVDIALLQEVENDKLVLNGFNIVFNIDHTHRGTAVALKSHIRFSNVERSLNSRLISLRIHDSVTIINIYAHSGSQNRALREDLFNFTLPYYLRNRTEHVIIGGDFNAVIHPRDATGESNFSLALKNSVQQLHLHDVWDVLNRGNTQYTYITHNSASRIDRLYVSPSLRDNLRCADTHLCCFTNHKALICRLALPNLGREQGRGFWSLRPHILTPDNLDEFQLKWDYWTRQKRNYDSWIQWWVLFGKPKVKSFFKWKTNQKYREYHQEYQILYQQLRKAYDNYFGDQSVLTNINRIKAKMLRLQRMFNEMFIHINESAVAGEPLSTFQIGERRKKKTVIEKIETGNNQYIDSSAEIEAFTLNYFRELYSEKEQEVTNEFDCELVVPVDSEDNVNCMNDITTSEIFNAIKMSASRKSPGPDGIPKDFYVRSFDIIHRHLNLLMNEALQGDIPTEFLDGVIVLSKKKDSGNSIKSYRPISLLNFDYKIFSRILKYRLDRIMSNNNVINESQKCSNNGRNIYQATLAIKDRILHLRDKKRKGKLVSFDLDHAFDRVDHKFLYRTMRSLGINTRLIDVFQRINSRSRSRLLVNGHLSSVFDIGCSVRQGDPISMHLFVLYLQPLVHRLNQICNDEDDIVVVYADDVSVITTDFQKLERIKSLFDRYGKHSGAVLNLDKTVCIDIGYYRQQDHTIIPWIHSADKIKILGVIFTNSVRLMTKMNWDSTISKFSQQLWLHKMRKLTLTQKVVLLNTYISSKIWYLSSIVAINKAYTAKITALIGSFLWAGQSIRVPIAQLALPYERGGLNLHLPSLKSKALLISRHLQEMHCTPYYASFIQQSDNPPNLSIIPTNAPCLKIICQEISYLPTTITENTTSSTINSYFVKQLELPKIVSKFPNIDWPLVWRNVKSRGLTPEEKSNYYLLVNCKIMHQDLLFRMERVDSPNCLYCNQSVESLQHKFANCTRVIPAWNILQQMLRTIFPSRSFTVEELIFPAMKIRASSKTKIMKYFINYVLFINTCNINIDINALKFHFESEV